MQWSQLLCGKRLGKESSSRSQMSRSRFQVDYDRLIFSSAFRRMQDKTQVVPLAESDYVRTRLTHSLEVSCVGRSLGMIVGRALVEKHSLENIEAADFGAIVAAAALAHDLGNPPFGHSGEDAIRHWFNTSPIAQEIAQELSPACFQDVRRYEGNAQGFRLITRLQMPDNVGGLQLTYATLGAFTKYPVESLAEELSWKGASVKKFGFFQSEKEFFKQVADEMGLIRRTEGAYCWARHPLVFLVEAADDLCYRIIDFEDGFRLGFIGYEEIETRFLRVIHDETATTQLQKIRAEKERIEFLRARAIGTVIDQVATCFLGNDEKMLAGELDQPLIDLIPCTPELKQITDRSVESVYSTPRSVEIEAAGYEVLGGLLDIFVGSSNDIAKNGKAASQRSKKLLQMVPDQFIGEDRKVAADASIRLMRMLDFVSGMTDSYAVSLYKKVKGISLPGR